jgi:hypothetical protein
MEAKISKRVACGPIGNSWTIEQEQVDENEGKTGNHPLGEQKRVIRLFEINV